MKVSFTLVMVLGNTGYGNQISVIHDFFIIVFLGIRSLFRSFTGPVDHANTRLALAIGNIHRSFTRIRLYLPSTCRQ